MYENLRIIHGAIADIDRYPYAITALFLVLIAGMVTGPRFGNANPFWWGVVDKLFSRTGDKLDRVHRTTKNLKIRGFIYTIMIMAACYVAMVLVLSLISHVPSYGVIELIFLSTCLTSGSVFYALLKIYYSLDKKQVEKGSFYSIAYSTQTDMSGQDDFSMTRTAMGYGAKAFDKGLVTPLFWYLVFGLSGAFFYCIIAGLAWRFGKEGFTKGFGSFVLFLERLFGFVPHCLSALLISLAGLFTPTGGMTRSLIGQVWGKGRATYHQGGLVLTALAYALDVSLGGPSVDLTGSTIKREWIGPESASAKIDPSHLRRCLYILAMAHLLLFMGLISALLWA